MTRTHDVHRLRAGGATIIRHPALNSQLRMRPLLFIKSLNNRKSQSIPEITFTQSSHWGRVWKEGVITTYSKTRRKEIR